MNARPASTAQKQQTRIQQQNRDRILAAALDIFSRFGYRGSTVDQIATATGMSKANLLYYFQRKQDIYVAVLSATLQQWLDPLQMLNPDGDPIEELWQYTRSKLQMSWHSPAASRLFANEILQGAPMIEPFLASELKDLVTTKCAIIQQWIDDGRLAAIEPLHLIFMIWASTKHYADFAQQIRALSNADDEVLFNDAERTLKTILGHGLRPA